MSQVKNLLPIGQRVTHLDGGPGTHGKGTIVAYNGVKPDSYAAQKPVEAANMVAEAFSDSVLKRAMLDAIANSFYSGDRYPYVVHWDPRNDDSDIGKKYPDGYKDVYGPDCVRAIDVT
jgi:trans-2-enoyl-CoA reductase